MRLRLLGIAFLLSCVCVGAFAQEKIGNVLVMLQGTNLTVKTGLPCNQSSTFVPANYEQDYIQLWCAIDNGDLQIAYDQMRRLPSRTDASDYNRGMVNDFRQFLALQPGLPDNPAYFMQGKGEDIVGDPNMYLSPAWCLQQYGVMFLKEEFGVNSQTNLVEVKKYPRWETTGGQGLDITFSMGEIKITAPAWDPWWAYYQYPDYNDLNESEQVYYVPSKGAKPTLSFAVTVVGDSSYVTGWSSLPLASNGLGEGYSVPLLSGSGQLLIRFHDDPPEIALKGSVISLYSPNARSGSPAPKRQNPPSGTPIEVPSYLKVIITPGYSPTSAGQVADTKNPPDGSMVLSSHYPKMVKQNAVALEGNTFVQIDETGKSEKRHGNADGSVSVEAPIKNIPVKGAIDAEVGYSSQLLVNGKMGYSASGPITYDERKWLWFRTQYHWVSVKSSSSPTGFVWRLDYFQLFQRIGLEREYNQHNWDGFDNKQEKPFIGTITGWRSKGWVWIPASGYLWWSKPGHWELRSVRWPYLNGDYRMIMYIGNSSPENPYGDTGLAIQNPPKPVFRNQ